MPSAIQSEQQLKKLLETVIQQGASDLHLSVARYPTLRVDGKLIPLTSEPVLTREDTTNLAGALLNKEQAEILQKELQIDFTYELEGKMRFRVNVFYETGNLAAALRLIPYKIRTIEELNLPSILHQIILHNQGLVLVVGPTGVGKSTTLAALVDEINHTRTEHIITIEDPIEYIYQQDRSIINQREVYKDVKSFANGLRGSFREDVDVLLVGEMRDTETIATTITAAETGHLVMATLHTNDSAQTIDRIIDIFPASQQQQVRSQLANILVAIVSQRLIPRIGGGRIPATEILLNNDAVGNLIREGQIHQIVNVLDTSLEEGMVSINRSLAELVKEEQITLESAEAFATDKHTLHIFLR
ncbi:MAG: PilT/PilU family type 4a pilus ATPase [Candidatus Moranbacteria bacterium]|nr:PilT/PilU family type 4a pilus ATPase [Candidatus Moranbacteria bacterium]